MKRLVSLAILAVLVALAHEVRADGGICMTTPTVPIQADWAQAVYDTLNNAMVLPADVTCFAIINSSEYSDHQGLVSVVGFIGDPSNWNVQDHGVWFSLVALKRTPLDGAWIGALQGTDEFEMMIASFPISPEAQLALVGGGDTDTDTHFDQLATTSDVYFPFASGTSVIYGTRGVHSHGNMSAVDFLSYSGDGMAPNAVYAATSGYVSNICRDDTQMGLKIGNFYYLHLVNDESIQEGRYYATHDYLGRLVTGSFDDECGYADQQASHYHLHFAFFPGQGGLLQVESWTLNVNTEEWTYGSVVRRPGQMIGPADWNGVVPPPPPEEPPPETPGPEPTPGAPPPGTPGGMPNGTNFWSFLVSGLRTLVQRIANQLPQHESIELAATVTEYAVLPVKIIYVTGVMNYTMAFIIIGVVLVLELVRAIYSIWMWIKRAIPVVG